MMHGCTEFSSTLHPCALAIAAHNMTEPIGANANATMTKSASVYHSHGNFLCGLPFITAIPNHRLQVSFGSSVRITDLRSLLDTEAASVFAHEFFDLADDTIEFVNE